MAKVCDVCGVRPATVRARVTTGQGETETLDLCEVDYRRLARQQRSASPLESNILGVFAVGDVRCGSVKRVGAAIGEGAAVVPQLHAFLVDAPVAPQCGPERPRG